MGSGTGGAGYSQRSAYDTVFGELRKALADALELVAAKLQSSLAVEGELPEDGLAAYGDDGDNLMLALARQIVSGEEDDAETVEAVFAKARDAEAVAEEYLVDDGWKSVEKEPETVEVNSNGHRHEADERQQSLFSWAEFMAEEPVKPRGRTGKPKPATASPFDWALALEREAGGGDGRRRMLDRETQEEDTEC